MRAISLWQPWASLWLSSRKLHETRSWGTNYCGPLVVHAAKRPPRLKEIMPGLRKIVEAEYGGNWAKELPLGALVGVLQLERCLPTDFLFGNRLYADEPITEQRPDDYWCGDFSSGRFAWRRGPHFTLFERPIPYIGRQGFFSVPESVVGHL